MADEFEGIDCATAFAMGAEFAGFQGALASGQAFRFACLAGNAHRLTGYARAFGREVSSRPLPGDAQILLDVLAAQPASPEAEDAVRARTKREENASRRGAIMQRAGFLATATGWFRACGGGRFVHVPDEAVEEVEVEEDFVRLALAAGDGRWPAGPRLVGSEPKLWPIRKPIWRRIAEGIDDALDAVVEWLCLMWGKSK